MRLHDEGNKSQHEHPDRGRISARSFKNVRKNKWKKCGASGRRLLVSSIKFSAHIPLQISLQDENEEAMARIQMAIDEWEQSHKDTDLDNSEREVISQTMSTAHWTLGSSEHCISLHHFESKKARQSSATSTFDFKSILHNITHLAPSDLSKKSRHVVVVSSVKIFTHSCRWRSAKSFTSIINPG